MNQISLFVRKWIIPDKSIILFCLVLLAIVWTSVLWQMDQDRRATFQTLMRDGDNLTRAFEEHVRRALKLNEQYLDLLKDHYESAQGVDSSTLRLIEVLGKDPLVAQIGLLGTDGRLMASLRPDQGNADYRRAPRFQAHISGDTGRYFLDQACLGLINSMASIPLSTRLNNRDGSFGGVAYISINAEYFKQFYRDMNFNDEYVIRIVGRDGFVRVSSKVREIGADLGNADLWKQLEQASSGYYRSSGKFYGKPLLMSYRAMSDYPLIVQAGVAESVLAPMVQRGHFYLWAAGAISLFILLFGGRLIAGARKNRQANQRIKEGYEELTAAHEELLAGEEDLRMLYDEVVATNEKLEQSRQEFADIFNAAADGLVVFDKAKGKILAVNRRMTEIFGYGEEELRQQRWILDNIRTKVLEEAATLSEQEILDSHGRKLMVEISASALQLNGNPCCLALIRDVTARKQMEENMEFLREKDPMTDVYNRAYFENGIMRMQTGALHNVGMFICDVDGLKLINDTLGHRQGDELLKKVAELLDSGVKKPEYVARIGGDEFAVVLVEATKERMENLEQYYRKRVIQYNDENPQLPLSLSVGWALETEEVNIEVLFKTADNNMYRQKMHQRKSVRGSIVQIMMKALEEKDHITEGHADRVGELMELMGSRLNLPRGAVADLRLLAKFHDIGKVGISDSILKKPGKLTEDENVIMRQHCEIGFRIAKSSPDLEPIADWILMHQEHWDGGGYPLGVSGEHIPVQCRILSIVDAFDAMTSDRPYRKAMPANEALEELRRGAGNQFDPQLVDIFIAIMEEQPEKMNNG